MIQSLAKLVGETFPELGGRSIAVSEVQPFDSQTSYPNLPIAVVALVGEDSKQNPHGGGRIELMSDIVVEFIFDPVRYTVQDGTDSAFFAFYNYENLRDRMLVATRSWRTPRNGAICYKSLAIDSDEQAVYIVMRFHANEVWCYPDEPDGVDNKFVPMSVFARVLQPRGQEPCCEPCEEPEDPVRRHGDPC